MMAESFDEIVDKRRESIHDNVHDIVHNMLCEASDWMLPSLIGLGPEPQWWEIRDALMAVVFEIEHMGRQDYHAEYVRKECL